MGRESEQKQGAASRRAIRDLRATGKAAPRKEARKSRKGYHQSKRSGMFK